ncbi:MAG TPA: YkyA family protein [Bacillales bacterium]|nr:YkyA family protein [Bacillales bacterium]
MLKKVSGTIVIFALFSVLLTGCMFGQKPAKKMYKHLEKAVQIEQGFTKYQKQLIKKENKEQQLYGKIIKLNINKFDKIKSLSKQASKLAGDREQLMQKEKKVMFKAYDEFSKVKPIAEKIDDPNLRKQANTLITAMNKRYKTFSSLYKDYITSVNLDQQLYQLLQKKDLEPGALKKQIDKINEKYKAINNEKQKFNQYTEKYNEAKKTFYNKAELKVKVNKPE